MRKLELACGVALSTLVLTGLSNNAFAAATIQCAQLQGIVFDPNIKSITSALSGSGATQFCNVNINWGRSADENIHIVVGLPIILKTSERAASRVAGTVARKGSVVAGAPATSA